MCDTSIFNSLIVFILNISYYIFFCLLVTRLLQHVESIYDFFYQWVLFLFFCFLLNQRKILDMIYLDLDSFHDIYNIITEHNQRQSPCLSLMFLTQFHGDIRTQAKEHKRRGTQKIVELVESMNCLQEKTLSLVAYKQRQLNGFYSDQANSCIHYNYIATMQ